MSLSEMVFLAFLGLVIFGPKKLAHVGQYVGRALAEFKKTSAAFQTQLTDEIKAHEVKSSDPKNTFPSEPKIAMDKTVDEELPANTGIAEYRINNLKVAV